MQDTMEAIAPPATVRELPSGEKPRLVAFCGRPRAGKSTAARRLVRRHGFVRTSFAEPIKAMLAELLRVQGASNREIGKAIFGAEKEHPNARFSGASPRQAMQTLGTEWGRALHPDFWVHAWARSLPHGRDIVVDDLRFPNEALAVRRLGGRVVRVVCPSIPILAGAAGRHRSETEVFEADEEILNDGDLATLWERVDQLV